MTIDSQKFWENRYQQGGTSGKGSFGKLAEFKANFINNFVKENNIHSVVELGCGDGNQLTLLNIPYYTGIDVSQNAIDLCKNKFPNDFNKKFIKYDNEIIYNNILHKKFDLTLSLDVIYHLVEDNIYKRYIYNLFDLSKKFIIIYSSNFDQFKSKRPHVKHRKFSDFVENEFKNFKLIKYTKNPYPKKDSNSSYADFYIYKKNKQ